MGPGGRRMSVPRGERSSLRRRQVTSCRRERWVLRVLLRVPRMELGVARRVDLPLVRLADLLLDRRVVLRVD